MGLAVAGVADELPNPNPPVVPPLPNVDELNIFYSFNLKEYQSGKEKNFKKSTLYVFLVQSLWKDKIIQLNYKKTNKLLF